MSMLNKHRNAVDRALLDMAEQIKTSLAPRVYGAATELKIERKDAIKLLALIGHTVDEVYGRYSKNFDKDLETLLKSVSTETAAAKRPPASKR